MTPGIPIIIPRKNSDTAKKTNYTGARITPVSACEASNISPKQNGIDVLPAPATFESFTLFPNLTVQLRLKTWRFAFPTNRKVRLRYHELQFACGSRNPAILYVKMESREETRRCYKFPSRSRGNALVYFNPDSDTLPFKKYFQERPLAKPV